MTDRTIDQLLAEAGYTHARDARTSTDYRHVIMDRDGVEVARMSAFEACEFLRDLGRLPAWSEPDEEPIGGLYHGMSRRAP